MQDYELVVLYHPDLEIDLDKALKKIEGQIGDVKGKILFTDNWGKRKLAYPIQKQEYAIYVYYEIQLPINGATKLEQSFNITNEVIRYLITKPTPNFGDREKHPMADDSAEDSKVEGDEAKSSKKKAEKDTKDHSISKKDAETATKEDDKKDSKESDAEEK